jgi:hypothetical protein
MMTLSGLKCCKNNFLSHSVSHEVMIMGNVMMIQVGGVGSWRTVIVQLY